jgi:hypothetical protein
MIGALILAAWLAGLVGFVGGAGFVAYRKDGVKLIGRQFVAEVATLLAGLSFILFVLQPLLVGWGFGP